MEEIVHSEGHLDLLTPQVSIEYHVLILWVMEEIVHSEGHLDLLRSA
jgi:hypothetical protein